MWTRLGGGNRTAFSAAVDRGGAPGARRGRLGETEDDFPAQEVPARSESDSKPARAGVCKPGEGTSRAKCPSAASHGRPWEATIRPGGSRTGKGCGQRQGEPWPPVPPPHTPLSLQGPRAASSRSTVPSWPPWSLVWSPTWSSSAGAHVNKGSSWPKLGLQSWGPSAGTSCMGTAVSSGTFQPTWSPVPPAKGRLLNLAAGFTSTFLGSSRRKWNGSWRCRVNQTRDGGAWRAAWATRLRQWRPWLGARGLPLPC